MVNNYKRGWAILSKVFFNILLFTKRTEMEYLLSKLVPVGEGGYSKKCKIPPQIPISLLIGHSFQYPYCFNEPL